jgi:hypothetical protein
MKNLQLIFKGCSLFWSCSSLISAIFIVSTILTPESCFPVQPTLPEIEKKIWQEIHDRVQGPRPDKLIYPFPDKFTKWLDDIAASLELAESLESREESACLYYFLDREIKQTGLPIEGFPKVVERLNGMGLDFVFNELAGGYVYRFKLRNRVITEFSDTPYAKLAILQNVSDGESYLSQTMTIQVIRDAEKLLSDSTITTLKRILATFYLAEAFETEWNLYIYTDESALSRFYTSDKNEARDKTLETYIKLAGYQSSLKEYAEKKVKKIYSGETTGFFKYNVFE